MQRSFSAGADRVVEDADPYEGGAQQEAPLIHRAGAVPLPPRGEGFGADQILKPRRVRAKHE